MGWVGSGELAITSLIPCSLFPIPYSLFPTNPKKKGERSPSLDLPIQLTEKTCSRNQVKSTSSWQSSTDSHGLPLPHNRESRPTSYFPSAGTTAKLH